MEQLGTSYLEGESQLFSQHWLAKRHLKVLFHLCDLLEQHLQLHFVSYSVRVQLDFKLPSSTPTRLPTMLVRYFQSISLTARQAMQFHLRLQLVWLKSWSFYWFSIFIYPMQQFPQLSIPPLFLVTFGSDFSFPSFTICDGAFYGDFQLLIASRHQH